MPKSRKKGASRTYRSPRREAQANATRDAILDAAHRLFLAKGYAATSIRAVAEAAEVSDQTVYNIFGDKPSLLVAVGMRVVAGQAGPSPRRDFEAELRAAEGPRERIAIAAAWSRTLWEQGMLQFESMLLDAAATDPRAAEIARSTWQQKYDDNKRLFDVVFPEDSRRPGDDVDDLCDVLFALDSAAFARILIDDRGWTYDTYERWFATIVRRLFTRIPD